MASCGNVYDACVVGAGVEGSATARYLASRGKTTLLLEQVMNLYSAFSILIYFKCALQA